MLQHCLHTSTSVTSRLRVSSQTRPSSSPLPKRLTTPVLIPMATMSATLSVRILSTVSSSRLTAAHHSPTCAVRSPLQPSHWSACPLCARSRWLALVPTAPTQRRMLSSLCIPSTCTSGTVARAAPPAASWSPASRRQTSRKQLTGRWTRLIFSHMLAHRTRPAAATCSRPWSSRRPTTPSGRTVPFLASRSRATVAPAPSSTAHLTAQ